MAFSMVVMFCRSVGTVFDGIWVIGCVGVAIWLIFAEPIVAPDVPAVLSNTDMVPVEVLIGIWTTSKTASSPV